MPSIVDAELTLRPAGSGQQEGAYQAELAVDAGSDVVHRYGPFAVAMDLERLREAASEPAQYGRALSAMLFAESGLREALSGARGMAAGRGVPLRLRLWLANGADALHGLAWELLALPGGEEPLATREDILFSRYLPAGADAAPPRPKGRPRALVAIANPQGLDPSRLAPIDVPGWQAHARTGLVGMELAFLPSASSPSSVVNELGATANPPEDERCTLARLVERIPGQDVLLLVCHGRQIDGAGHLLLEDAQGGGAMINAGVLAQRLGGTLRLPRLAVLVVCESAGNSLTGGGALLESLGPRLVKLGIPAVLAVYGELSFETADLFFPAMFRALQEDGVIDRAVARARRAIIDQPDERAPVLLMSLKSGRLWREDAARQEPEPERPGAIGETGAVDQRALYAVLSGAAFTLSDLEELCFELGIDWDNLRGQTKPEKARALIRYCTSRGQYDRLVAAVRAARGDV